MLQRSLTPLNEAPKDFATALKAVADLDFLKSEKHRNQHMRADRDGAHPDLLIFEGAFIRALGKAGVPAFAHCVWRDRAEQTRLLLEGFSKARFGESAHNYGMAVDVIHGTKAWAMSLKSWEIFGHIGHETAKRQGIKVVWGGRDGPQDRFDWDPAHWELAGWRGLRSKARAELHQLPRWAAE